MKVGTVTAEGRVVGSGAGMEVVSGVEQLAGAVEEMAGELRAEVEMEVVTLVGMEVSAVAVELREVGVAVTAKVGVAWAA